MPEIIVFVGPSLGAERRSAPQDIDLRPPAAVGDLYRATLDQPRAIGLIDGFFESTPAVWHKEILFALSRGIPVFGAASIGALRAVELEAFGMRGVGTIFGWYRDGTIEDDGEVALSHGPAELDYLPLSEPLVNVRATLALAAQSSLIPAAAADALLQRAREIFYKDRSWEAITAGSDLPADEAQAFLSWLRSHSVDQKRADAQVLIDEIRKDVAGGVPPFEAAFAFETTAVWEIAVAAHHHADPPPLVDAILDEVRSSPDAFAELRRRASLRLLADRSPDDGRPLGRMEAGLTRFRVERGLLTQSDFELWLRRNALTAGELQDLLQRKQNEEHAIQDIGRHRLAEAMMGELKLNGRYPELRERAERRLHLMEAQAGAERPAPPPPVLVDWYFTHLRGTSVPEDLDEYASLLGFSGRAEFYRWLTRQYSFAKVQDESDGGRCAPSTEERC